MGLLYQDFIELGLAYCAHTDQDLSDKIVAVLLMVKGEFKVLRYNAVFFHKHLTYGAYTCFF